jgi:hypothetical protein
LSITAAHAGLTFQNFEGEHAVVSGGVPIAATKADWKPYKVATGSRLEAAPPVLSATPLPPGWTLEKGVNNVFGRAKPHASSEDMVFLGHFTTWDPCVAAMEAQNKSKGPFNSLTFHTPGYSGKPAAWDGDCYGMTGTEWTGKRGHPLIWSAKGPHAVPSPPPPGPGPSPPRPPPPPPAPLNIWQLDLSTLSSSAAALSIESMRGLRIDGNRGIRAKYPNGNPEISGPDAVDVLTYQAGWITQQTDWIVPVDKWAETKDDISNAADWPGVNWPMVVESKPGNSTLGAGEKGPDPGACGDYHIGHGGFCDDLHDPSSGPTGYWCSQNPPRGQCYDPETRTSKGCTQTHMSPDGLKYNAAMLPNAANYSDIKGAVVQAWRCVRWFTNLCLVESINKETGEIMFDKSAGGGCNQVRTSLAQSLGL